MASRHTQSVQVGANIKFAPRDENSGVVRCTPPMASRHTQSVQVGANIKFASRDENSGVGSDKNPASHTFNTATTGLWLNGMPMSEMMFDIFTAANLQVPTCFVCGDEALCETAKALIPNITTFSSVKGRGAASISCHPEVAVERIKEAAQQALSKDFRDCMPTLPKEYTMRIQYPNHKTAYFNSFYPGMKQLDTTTLEYTTDSWYDMLIMVHFVLDK